MKIRLGRKVLTITATESTKEVVKYWLAILFLGGIPGLTITLGYLYYFWR